MLRETDFIKRLEKIKQPVKSITGKVSYSNLGITESTMTMTFIRDNTGENWKIDLKQLYKAYLELEVIDTVVIRKYTPRVQSPACAFLIGMGLYDSKRNRV